jgi:2-haloacid dehalogenase
VIRALVFDVFGTLVDWRTSVAVEVAATFGARGVVVDGLALADAWRAEYQPAMERIRSGGRGYVPLDDLHRENLERVLAAFGLSLQAPEVDGLARAWERLTPWPDVPEGLRAARGRALVAPCSNGSIGMMARLARHAGLSWDGILGADLARDYKPKPVVYLAACAALRLPPAEVMMVAAHNGDLAAARAAGLATGFIPRPLEHGPSQTSDLSPEADWDVVAEDLPRLARGIPGP